MYKYLPKKGPVQVWGPASAKFYSDVFPNTWLKIARAEYHLQEIRNNLSTLGSEYYDIKVIKASNGKHQLQYQPSGPLGKAFGLLVADCIHCSRSALDQMATAIVRRKHPREKPYFPVHRMPKDFAGTSGLELLDECVPGLKDLLVKLWGNKLNDQTTVGQRLFQLHGLNNQDKHNAIITNVVVASVKGISYETGALSAQDGTAVFDADNCHVLCESTSPIELVGTPHASVNVKLQDTDFDELNGMRAEVFLSECLLALRHIVDHFEAFTIEHVGRESDEEPPMFRL